MITPIFKASIKDGKLHIIHRDGFCAYLKQFGDKPFELIVRKVRKSRSGNQNNYYWGVVLFPISENTGHTCEELHEAFKRKFLQQRDEKGLQFTQSTTELTTTGMMDYVESVRRFASQELGIVIPDPNEAEAG